MRFFTEAGAPARPPARAENHALKTMCAENEHKMLLHPRSCRGPCVKSPQGARPGTRRASAASPCNSSEMCGALAWRKLVSSTLEGPQRAHPPICT